MVFYRCLCERLAVGRWRSISRIAVLSCGGNRGRNGSSNPDACQDPLGIADGKAEAEAEANPCRQQKYIFRYFLTSFVKLRSVEVLVVHVSGHIRLRLLREEVALLLGLLLGSGDTAEVVVVLLFGHPEGGYGYFAGGKVY